MTIASTPAHTWVRDLLAAWRHARWKYPEWPLGLLAVAAWMAMFAMSADTTSEHSSHPAMHTHSVQSLTAPSTYALHLTVLHWTLMVMAMMVPTILPSARTVALGSRWRRRQRGQALFALGYLTPWITLGAVIVGALSATSGRVSHWLFPGALAAAALWELTRWKVRLLRACHRIRPIPPDGWRADAGCLMRGLFHGGLCIGACWALMTAMMVADHVAATLLMLPLTTAVVIEKLASRPDRVVRPMAAALGAAAAVSTLV
jgi:predicted metal-binding membrane protein